MTTAPNAGRIASSTCRMWSRPGTGDGPAGPSRLASGCGDSRFMLRLLSHLRGRPGLVYPIARGCHRRRQRRSPCHKARRPRSIVRTGSRPSHPPIEVIAEQAPWLVAVRKTADPRSAKCRALGSGCRAYLLFFLVGPRSNGDCRALADDREAQPPMITAVIAASPNRACRLTPAVYRADPSRSGPAVTDLVDGDHTSACTEANVFRHRVRQHEFQPPAASPEPAPVGGDPRPAAPSAGPES